MGDTIYHHLLFYFLTEYLFALQDLVRGRIACLTMGNPLDYAQSVSLGVVAGLARTLPTERDRPLERVIQTDAAINSGNSGGPLVDAAGAVIGVNTCVDLRGSRLGFAVPGTTVDWVLRQVMQYGDIARGALGVALAHRTSVVEGSSAPRRSLPTYPPAHRVRFKVDDIVLALNGQPVSDRADLSYLLTRDMINKPVPVTVLRNGRRMEFAAPVSLYRVPGAVYRERPRS